MVLCALSAAAASSPSAFHIFEDVGDAVANVQLSGGVAAVFYNDQPGGFIDIIGSVTQPGSSTLPAISLSQEDGQDVVTAQLGEPGTVVSATGDFVSRTNVHYDRGGERKTWLVRDLADGESFDGAGQSGAVTVTQVSHTSDHATVDIVFTSPPCSDGQLGDPCTSDADCCSGKCKGKPGEKTCK